MNRDELLQALTDLGTIEDGAELRNRLTTISDEVRAVLDSNDALTASNATLEQNNKTLQEYNMQLFLRVGGPHKDPNPAPPPTDTPKYEDLFDEKGELK